MNPEYKIIVVDDEIGRAGDHQAEFLERSGRRADEFVFCTGQDGRGRNDAGVVIAEAEALWPGTAERRLALVLLDVQFNEPGQARDSGRFGLDLLRQLRERLGRAVPIVMLTDVAEVVEAANAMQADDFLPKRELTQESLTEKLCANGLFPDPTGRLQGVDPRFLLALRDLRRGIIRGFREILLLGETGTGKSDFARFAHDLSKRAGPYVHWYGRAGSDAAVHRNQLFGHWSGAFTGAGRAHAGDAERAHDGTLFLDEIAELSPEGQAELLEYRQRGRDGLRRVTRIGHRPTNLRGRSDLDIRGVLSADGTQILVDTLLVAATNQPIDDEAWRNRTGFRQDLYNRLGHVVRLPALRERPQDISIMFAGRASQLAGRPIEIAPEARSRLEAHEWRLGNVQELRSVAESVVAALGAKFSIVHSHHLDSVLAASRPTGASVGADRSTTAASEAEVRRVQGAGFVDIELQSLVGLASLLRAAVVETRRPTGIGSLTDILMQATGVKYPATDVQREVRYILEPLFEPNARQRARWSGNEAYNHATARVTADPILSWLYRYSTRRVEWDEAKAAILESLGR